MLLGGNEVLKHSCVAEASPPPASPGVPGKWAMRGTSHVTSKWKGWRSGVSRIWGVTLYSHFVSGIFQNIPGVCCGLRH